MVQHVWLDWLCNILYEIMWDSRVQLSPRTSQGDPDALEPTEKVFRLGSLKFSLIRSAAYMDSGPAS